MGGQIYIFHDDIVGGYAIGRDEEEVFWRGRRIDVTDLALRKELELGNVRIDQSCHNMEYFAPGWPASVRRLSFSRRTTS